MKTLTGEDIGEATLGILYICDYDYSTKKLKPIIAHQYTDPEVALHYYCETPNPPSQLAMGRTREDFEVELIELHKKMQDHEWQKELAEYL